MLSKAEWQQVVVEWNETSAEYPRHRCLHQLFEEQVDRDPDAVAVVLGDTELSYRSLDERANRLAHELVKLGVGPEMIVGVCLERSLELIVTLLAILKAGGAYLPLDPTYPQERLAFMIEECSTSVVVTQGIFADRLPIHQVTLVVLSDAMLGIDQNPSTPPDSRVISNSLAYVIYTSGSTGRPKGVAISHRAVCNVIHFTNTSFPIGRGDVFLQISPFTFDASVFEIFTTLLSGAKLLLIKPGGQREIDYLVRLMLSQHVTVAIFVPSTLRMIIADESFGSSSALRRVFCGGEAMSLDLMKWFQQRSSAELVNLYGPTEATIYCTEWVCNRSWRNLAPPVGRPIFNAQVYILDEKMHPVPINSVGEIYLGGDGLARGYVNRPESTARRFIRNPFSKDSSSRLYRTGDLGFWNASGILIYMGRVDEQIKLRGFRIEPAEIEMALLQSPAISQAWVICREDTPGNQQLVAYCIPSGEEIMPRASDLRRLLARSLPDYMIPSAFVEMERFPLNANGKRDRRELPPPNDSDGTEQKRDLRLPKDLLEQRLVELWQKVLGRKNIGIHDNFFDLGGHSLTAAILTGEIEKLIYERLPIAVFFQTPTVAELASYLKQKEDDPEWSSLVPLQPAGDKTPLFVMHGMGGDVFAYLHFARLLAPDRPVYGLQSIGLDGTHPNHDTIEAMADHYTQQIRALQPSGPYCLLGYSLGGWIAYAVADQLIRRGGRIALLALLDTEAEAKVDLDDRLRLMGSLLLDRIPSKIREYRGMQSPNGVNFFRQGVKAWFNHLEKLNFTLTDRSVKSSGFREQEARKISAEEPGSDYFEILCKNYRPPKLNVFVHLLIPSGRKPWQISFWHRYARNGVEIHRIFEKHEDFINPDMAGPLADIIRRLLTEVQGE